MKSSEIREKTGLTEKAMRLYEDKGLVTPQIREQGSRRIREYSEEDLAVLMTVAALRKARFSIDQIGQMLDDLHKTQAIFAEYRAELAREMRELSELMEKVEAVPAQSVTNPAALAAALTLVAEPMEIPVRDMEYRPYRWEDISDEKRREAFERFWKKQEKRLDRERLFLELCGLFGRVALCILLPSLIVAALLYSVPFTREVNMSVPAVEYNVETGEVVSQTTLTMRGKAKYYLLQQDHFDGVLTIDGFSPYSRYVYDRWNSLESAFLAPEANRVLLDFTETTSHLNFPDYKWSYSLYREPLSERGLKWTEYIRDVYFADPKDPFAGMVYYIMEPHSATGASSSGVKLIAPASDAQEAAAIWEKLKDRWAQMYG